jgi:hypothetical protein
VVVVKVKGHTIEPEANLSGANLTGVFCHRANLREANLSRAILTGADLTEADLTGAQADEDTVWPEGFDPVAAGVIVED